MDEKQRSRLLVGEKGMETLEKATVLVVGTGGVGGMCAEALARSGIGHLVLIDKDTVEASNRNRQLCALSSTTGQEKVEVFKARIHDIDPHTEVTVFPCFYDRDMDAVLDRFQLDFVCDCIDSLKSKEDLIRYCKGRDIPIICSMGMARKMDPARIAVIPLEKTEADPLAKRLRIWARKERIGKVMTVSSTEQPVPVERGSALPSMMMVPATAGLVMAAYVVKTLLQKGKEQ